jgi:1-acyl-sn-glycerol-3-phosphate acyltransferase
MIIIRSIIFNILLVCWTLILGIVSMPILFMPKGNVLFTKIAKIWACIILKLLEFICQLKLEVRGRKNIPKNPYIIAAKHQSALDIIALIALLDVPKFIMKESLKYIPVIGIFSYKMGMIMINRAGGSKTIKIIIEKSKEILNKNDNILIFPEGTRTKIGEKVRYKSGIYAIYKEVKVKILPVALNTGLYWGRNSFIKYPGTFIIEFIPLIDLGLEKKEFEEILTDKIESTCEKIGK